MISKTSTDTRTKLSQETFDRCMSLTRAFLQENSSIRNRGLRKIAGIEYDQAIAFFNRAILEKKLTRMGESSGTHYVLHEGDEA